MLHTDYIIDYELCALLFLFIVMAHYFTTKKTGSLLDRLFSVFLYLAAATIILDLITAYTIPYYEYLPLWLNYILLFALFSMQNTLSALISVYVLAMAGVSCRRMKPLPQIALIPYVISELLLISTPFTGWVFTFRGGYAHNSGFLIIYGTNFFYLLLSIATIILLRKRLKPRQSHTILSFAVFCFAASMIQFFIPQYLTIGCAIGLSVSMFYLSLQNPEGKIDAMTGCFNRLCYLNTLRESKMSGKHIYVTFVSFDDMKKINSTYTMDAGTQLLRIFAEYSQEQKRGDVFRLLGDQFAVVSYSEKDSLEYAAAIKDRFARPFRIGGNDINASACICYGAHFKHKTTVSDFVNITERAVANAKAAGHNAYIRLDKNILNEVVRILDIENELEHAVESGRLYVCYQPIYSVTQERYTSFEALARFDHPTLGTICPSEFIPLAEKRGLINDFGRHILRLVCETIKSADLINKYNLEYTNVNLSALELLSEGTPERIISVLDEYGLRDRIKFEVTETAATVTQEFASDCITRLNQAGISFAMDDYGSGYANIDGVIKMPFDTIKLDRSLIIAGEQDPRSRIVLEKTCEMLHELGYTVITEGVETKEQDDMARAIKSDCIQGFAYSMPLSRDELIVFLEENK